MSVEQITVTRYKCRCEHDDCRWEWVTDAIPERCAKCKKMSWQDPTKHASKKYAAHGKNLTVVEWAELLGVARHTLRTRIRSGWSPEEVFTAGLYRVGPKFKNRKDAE